MIGAFINKIANFIFGPIFGGTFEFASPWWLLLLIPVIGLFLWKRWRKKSSLRYSNIGLVKGAKQSTKSKLYPVLSWLELIGLILIALACARPRSGYVEEKKFVEGLDIILAVDISSSMLAEDFKPNNRLEAAKLVAEEEFITKRSNDRIGLVIFASKAFTQCPLTLDYGALIEFLHSIETGQIEDGTAIGNAIATAVNRLRDSKSKSKIIILLTDGINNRGSVDPITAARAAKALNVKIYTIGAGKRGYALYPVDDPIFGKRHVRMPVELDEKSLMEIANITGGMYSRATDTESLRQIFAEIDKLEKTKIETQYFTRNDELFRKFVILGLILLGLNLLLSNTIFRKLP